jgi:DNA-binding transcriptional LysR family regulator
VFDWNDLRYLLAVARAGTLAGAARELGVEHSTVKRRLAAMEAAMGARLFTQSRDGFALTPVGQDVLPLAQDVAKAIDGIERRVHGADTRVEGTVRLTTSEALSGYMVKQLAALRANHPALLVEVLAGNRSYDLSRREADIAVRAAPVQDPDLIARKVSVAGWSLYAAQSYVDRKGAPAPFEDLRGHELIVFDATLANSPGAVWVEAHGCGAEVVLRANSLVAALNGAVAGIGIAALPCFIGDVERALVRLTPAILGTRDVWLVVHPDLAKVARVRVVMDFLLALFERDRALWAGLREPG